MRNLTERLRIKFHPPIGGDPVYDVINAERLEAADEIERLEVERNRMASCLAENPMPNGPVAIGIDKDGNAVRIIWGDDPDERQSNE